MPKKKLFSIVISPVIPYIEKLKQVASMIRTFIIPHIKFITYDTNTLNKLINIEQCLNLNSTKCTKASYCAPSTDSDKDECQLLIPKTNLISGGNNEVEYFYRVADELIKFARIRTFIFKPQTFLSFTDIPYDLNDNEIILLEDLLYGDYFEGLVPAEDNPFVRNPHVWDTTEPLNSVPYVDKFNIDIQMKTDVVNKCIIMDVSKKSLTLGYWKDHGLENYDIYEFNSAINCSWELVKEIIKINSMDSDISVQLLVNTLVELFSVILKSNNRDLILQIMSLQGKKAQSDAIQAGTALDDIITSTNYYLTALDFFLLSKRFNIPLILLCRTKIPTVNSRQISFLQNKTDTCFVILCGKFSLVNSDTSPTYGIVSRDESIQLDTSQINSFGLLTKNNTVDLDSYLQRTRQAIGLEKRIRKSSTVKVQRAKTTVRVDTEKMPARPVIKKKKVRVRLGKN